MPAAFRIFPEEDLIYIHYSGLVLVREYAGVIEAGTAHADFRADLKFLVDLSDITDFERDYSAIMAIQARLVDFLGAIRHEATSVFVAPHKVALEGAQLVQRSWSQLNVPIRRSITPRLEEAADLFGLPAERLAQMREMTMAGAQG